MDRAAEPEADIRSLAVEIVDNIHGYTLEFSSSPNSHRAQYDWVEDRLRGAFGPDSPA